MRCNSEGWTVGIERAGCVVVGVVEVEDEDDKRSDVEEGEDGRDEDKKEQGQSWGQNGFGCWLGFGLNGDQC